jgi:hypothetical protein
MKRKFVVPIVTAGLLAGLAAWDHRPDAVWTYGGLTSQTGGVAAQWGEWGCGVELRDPFSFGQPFCDHGGPLE